MAIVSHRTFPSEEDEKYEKFYSMYILSTIPALLAGGLFGDHQGMCQCKRIPRETNKPSFMAVATTDVRVIHFQVNDQELNI